MRKYRLLIIPAFLFVFALAKAKEVTYTIAPEKGDCYGMNPMKCLQVKKGKEALWSNFYSNIEGFDYQPGYTYVLRVKEKKVKNPPADGSTVRYILKKVVYKIPATIR